jgi:hypothetical protein
MRTSDASPSKHGMRRGHACDASQASGVTIVHGVARALVPSWYLAIRSPVFGFGSERHSKPQNVNA